MDWRELQDHLRRRYQLAHDEDQWAGLFIKFGDQPIELQRVKIEHVEALERRWILLLAEVCREHRLPPREALLHNLLPAMGALALEGEHYVYRHVLPLDGLTTGMFDLAMEFVAREAVLLRKRAHALTRTAVGDQFSD